LYSSLVALALEAKASSRPINIIQSTKKFNVDSIEVEPVAIEHSIPGVSAFILYTSKGSIACTADIRFHGRRGADTERFLEKCATSDLDYLLCEGTRIAETNSKTELDVESEVKAIVDKTTQLVVCAYPPRDLDRLLSFYKGRLVVKLPKERVEDLVAAREADLFDPGHGRVSKEWASFFIKLESKWPAIVEEARAFVASLR
jgi:mRNA degradation ribonuclease J1/J2